MPFAQSWSKLHQQTRVGWLDSWQGIHKPNLPGIRMWKVLRWTREFGLTQRTRKCVLPGLHRKTEAHAREMVQCRGVKMPNGRTAVHPKHIAFLRHLLLSHITSLSCWNSAWPPGTWREPAKGEALQVLRARPLTVTVPREALRTKISFPSLLQCF